jgi:putative ABC transport system permease protein
MNPGPMILADLRQLRWTGLIVAALVAACVAAGVLIGMQERAFRRASARAADDFPLLVGAPGSAAQLVLSSVYLRLEALPLLDGETLRRLQADPRVAAVAPIAFGDVARGYPVIGTTAAFATRGGNLATTDGRMFANEREAVVGAGVALALGDRLTPSHGHGVAPTPGHADEDEAKHAHAGHDYVIVGRMAATGGPWDQAIITPVEAVWEVHGLGDGHAEEGAVGPPFDAEQIPGSPALVVTPRSVADAYALRADMKKAGLLSVFPAETLVEIYAALGDVRQALLTASAINDGLVFLAVTALLVTVAATRRKRYATLRALGAPRAYVLATVWGASALLTGVGCLAGLALAVMASKAFSAALAQRTGVVAPLSIEAEDVMLAIAVFAAGSLFAVIPAWLAGRGDIVEGLRS